MGKDDRIQYFQEVNPKLKALGLSTAVLLNDDAGLLEKTDFGFRLSSKNRTFKQQDSLCSDEPFADEPAPGFCSSFWVGKDLLVTAAHCVFDCGKTSVVFDFLKTTATSPLDIFLASSVYHCKKVVAIDRDSDWAVLQLDREVIGRTRFTLQKSDLPIGSSVMTLGFPRGIALKIAGPAPIVENVNSDGVNYFEAPLDIFGGNSGGPVINSTTLEVAGILAVGFGEFEEETIDPITQKKCQRLRRIPFSEDPTPVWVVRTSRFFDAVHIPGK